MSLTKKLALIAAPIAGVAGAGALMAFASPVLAATASPSPSPAAGQTAPGSQSSPSAGGQTHNCPR